MANLIITMIGIALFVALSVGGVVYIDSGLVVRKQNEELVKSGFIELISNYHIYKINNKEALPSSDWSSIIRSPRSPEATAWSYNSTASGNYFCLSGQMDTESFFNNAKNLLEKNFNSVFTGDVCGVTIDDESFSPGDTKGFTIWLDSSQVSQDSIFQGGQTGTFSIELERTDTGETLKNGDTVTFYKGGETNHVTVTVTATSDDVGEIILSDNTTDMNSVIVCGVGGVDGCNEGTERTIKVVVNDVFEDGVLTITATDGASTAVLNLTVNGKERYVCDTSDPLSNLETNGDGYYLIGNEEGNPVFAKEQLLCISQNQTSEVLSANYKMTADVDFDIDFTVTKTYQDVDGNTNATKDDTYKFLYDMSVVVNSNGEDWDGSGSADTTSTEGWIPLGTFIGGFDGDGYAISNLYINAGADSSKGFFSSINGADVKNLNIENIAIKKTSSGYYVGGLAGLVKYSTVDNVSVSGNLLQGYYIGGFAGYMVGSTIDNSSVNVDVYSSLLDVGGFIGYASGWADSSYSPNLITSCYSTGDIKGLSSKVGGFIGYSWHPSTIERSYATGNVYGGGDKVGGFIGESYRVVIKSC